MPFNATEPGISIERLKPAHPEQNGRHERMHLTLKKEATKPAAKNFLQQQGKFDRFIEVFNQERPHQAIGMKYPAELYVSSNRSYKGLSDLEYPFHDRTITVTCCGRICIGRRKINLSTVFAGQNVGIKQVSDKVWLVSFMQYDLGFFDHETGRITSAENPFGAKVLPMCPARYKTLPMCSERTGNFWWPGRELNPRHADFQPAFGGSRGL
jgi:putative transposase